jgi:splicing factor 3B subunit 1
MREAQLARERDNTMRNIEDKKKREAEELAALDAVPTKASGLAAPAAAAPQAAAPPSGKRSRWDAAVPGEA